MANQKTTTQKLARLKVLRDDAGANIYERCRLAAEVLADTDWIAAIHGGSLDAAEQAVQDEYFADLGGYVTLGTLTDIYRTFPDEAEWKARKYNLQVMEAEWEEARAEEREVKPRVRPQYKVLAEEAKERAEKAERQAEQVETLLSGERQSAARLREELETLRMENAELRGRVRELERLVDKRLAGVG